MPPGSMPPPQAPDAPVYRPASAGQRLANYFIDIIGIYILASLIGVIEALAGVGNFLVIDIVGIFISPVYYIFFEGIWQRSPGKYVTRTKVVALDGSKPEFSHIVGRSFTRIVPFEALSFLFSAHPVGWHDRWSGTLVVDKNYTPENVRMIDRSDTSGSTVRTIILVVIGILVGIAIIGLLASIVLASLNVARGKGRDARRLADIEEIQLGLALYYDANNAYPSSLSQLVPNDIQAVPQDPSGGSYDYYSCTPTTYHLGASLEDPTNPSPAQAAHEAPMCPQDPIQGNSGGKCVATDAGSYCYDVDQATVSSTSTAG